MQLTDFYPIPEVLVDQEARVLDYLRNDPYIKDRHPELAKHSASYLARNRGSHAGFEFFSWIDVQHSESASSKNAKRNIRLVLGALIQRTGETYANVSYCLAVCKIRSLAVLRKFHFDVTPAKEGRNLPRQAHPQCHLQYCGEMIPHMETQIGIRRAQLTPLYPNLSEPRIFSWPTSLALLLDMVLHEFPDEKSLKFRSTPEWRRIVRDHENVMLRPFLEKCLKVMKQRGHVTLADAFYVG